MLHNRKAMVLVAALVLFGLFGIVGSAIQQAAWSQGFAMGLLAEGGDAGNGLAPYLLYNRGFGPSLFGGIGWFFKLIFFGFVFMAIAKFLRFGAWHMAGGPEGEWGKHWGHHKGYRHGYSRHGRHCSPGHSREHDEPESASADEGKAHDGADKMPEEDADDDKDPEPKER